MNVLFILSHVGGVVAEKQMTSDVIVGAEGRGSQRIWLGTPMVSLGFSWGKTVVHPMISHA